jgi:hypothetical protein
VGIGGDFFVDILQGRGERDAGVDSKTEPVCLVGFVVWVLSENHNLEVVPATAFEGIKNARGWGIDFFGLIFLADKSR